MAVAGSGLYVANMIGNFTGIHVLNWDLETHKCALINNTSAPNFSAAAAAAKYGDASLVEITGTGYTAGGNVLTATTVTESPASVLMFDGADVSWTASTLSGVRATVIYADAIGTPVADPAFCVIDFGADYATNNGTFTIQWAAAGIFTWDVY